MRLIALTALCLICFSRQAVGRAVLVITNAVYFSNSLIITNGGTVTNTTFGLQNWWRMNENSGSVTVDSADSADGTLINSPQWIPGQIGSALLFNGAGGTYLQLTNNCGTGDGSFTVAFWFLKYSTNAIANGGYVLEDTDNDTSKGFVVEADTVNFSLRVVGSGGDCIRQSANAGTGVDTNVWYHVLMTWGGVISDFTTIHIYTNAVEFPTYNTTQNGSGTHVQNTTPQRTIGKKSSGIGFDGILDDIRIYNRVLTAGEITNLYLWRGQP